MKPTIGQLCEQGERAFANDEYEEALEWFELACAGTMYSPDPPGAVARLLDYRFERLAELRAMVPWRKVHRLAAGRQGHMLAVMTCMDRNEGLIADRGVRNQIRNWRGGASDIFTDGFTDKPVGQAQTFFAVLRWAARQEPFTHLTLLEDDIALTKNALDYIATTKIDDDLAFISWFSNETCTIPRTLPVLSCYKARDYQFNQAITFPARTVHKLLASDVLKNWSEPHGADRIYKDVFPDQYVAVHYPNLVQHVGGAESLVGNNHHGLRTSPSFPGEDFDALTLVR